MYNDYLLRFRSKTTEELLTKQRELEEQESAFVTQAEEDRSYTKDLGFIRDQLNAIAFVLRERGGVAITRAPVNVNIGTIDFSQIQ